MPGGGLMTEEHATEILSWEWVTTHGNTGTQSNGTTTPPIKHLARHKLATTNKVRGACGYIVSIAEDQTGFAPECGRCNLVLGKAQARLAT